MVQTQVSQFRKLYDRFTIPKPWDRILILSLNVLLTIPLFIILHQNLKKLGWPFFLDRLLIFVCLVGLLQLILTLLRKVTFISIALYLVFLFWGKGGRGGEG